ncbi:MAG TPA: putative quinol monooxygenase [Thermoleophilaceae bacterium]|jgi:quinol monooxygenase YgiN
MIIITANARLRPEAREEAVAAATRMQELSSAEPGCQAYGFWVAIDDPDRLLLFERWDDAASLETHLGQPHTAEFGAAIGGFVAEPPELVRYEAEPGEF